MSFPTLETEEGSISNMGAILRYLSGTKAYLGVAGQSAFDKAQVDLWMDMVVSDLSSACQVRMVTAGLGPWTQEGLKESSAKFLASLERFEEHLALRTYFVGHSVTLADLAFTATLACNRSMVCGPEVAKAYPNVCRHFQFMTNTTFFQAVMGKTFCQKTPFNLADSEKTKEFACAQAGTGAPAQGKPKAQQKKQGDNKGKQGDNKGKKQQPAPKKKEAPPPPPPKKEEPELTPEQLAEKEADSKAGAWFFDYKTLFTNAPDRNAAIDTLVEQWDSERFSMWFAPYEKLASEGKNMTKSKNLVNYFIECLLAGGLNKSALGVFGAYGTEEDHDYYGMWMFKGKEVHPVIAESNLGEYMEYNRVDMKNPEDVKRVKSFWLNVDLENPKPVEKGQNVLHVKLFK